jgi:hypothetical protein
MWMSRPRFVAGSSAREDPRATLSSAVDVALELGRAGRLALARVDDVDAACVLQELVLQLEPEQLRARGVAAAECQRRLIAPAEVLQEQLDDLRLDVVHEVGHAVVDDQTVGLDLADLDARDLLQLAHELERPCVAHVPRVLRRVVVVPPRTVVSGRADDRVDVVVPAVQGVEDDQTRARLEGRYSAGSPFQGFSALISWMDFFDKTAKRRVNS